MRIACGFWALFLCTACGLYEDVPPSSPFVLDAGPAAIDAVTPIDAGCHDDAPIDADVIVTHPPFPPPQACIPICLDGGV